MLRLRMRFGDTILFSPQVHVTHPKLNSGSPYRASLMGGARASFPLESLLGLRNRLSQGVSPSLTNPIFSICHTSHSSHISPTFLTDISYRHFLFSQAISLLELRDGITPPLTHVRNATASLVRVLDEANINQTNKQTKRCHTYDLSHCLSPYGTLVCCFPNIPHSHFLHKLVTLPCFLSSHLPILFGFPLDSLLMISSSCSLRRRAQSSMRRRPADLHQAQRR